MFSLRKVIYRSTLIVCVLIASSSYAQIGKGDNVILPSWNPDGTRVAIVIGNDIEVRDTATTNLLYVLSGHTDFVPMTTWSPNNNMIATPSSDQTIKIWSAVDGKLIRTLSGHHADVMTVVWSPDGAKLLSWGFDTRPNLFVWDVITGDLLASYDGGNVITASFSPDGQKLVSLTSLSLSIRDGQTLDPLVQSPRVVCCTNQMRTVAWSPDSHTLVTGSVNGLVTLWDANTGQILRELIGNPHYQLDSRDVGNVALSWVRDVIFTPEGDTILAISGDGTLKEWNVITGEQTHETRIAPLYAANWSQYSGRLAVLTPNAWDGVLTDADSFDASEVTGTLNIIVPNPSLDLLQSIANACDAPSAVKDELPVSGTQLAAFVSEIEALSDGVIPSACAADLIAVAEALQTK